MEDKFYVYMHVNLTNCKPFYIGKGSGKRAYSYSRRSKMWRYTVDKYGGFGVVFLEKGLQEIESFELECYWIKRIGRRDNGNGTLVNFTDGGPGLKGLVRTKEQIEKMAKTKIGKSPSNKGVAMSQTQKDKISKSCKGRVAWSKGIKTGPMSQETKDKISKGNMGKKMTQEAKDKISKKHKGRKMSEEQKKLLSEIKKGKPSPSKGKKRGTSWNKGIPMSEESKKKLSESHKKRHLEIKNKIENDIS